MRLNGCYLFLLVVPILGTAIFTRTISDGEQSPLLAPGEEKHLSNIRQLTHGGLNAEAYWSPDGRSIIFQSTRPPYEADQVFTMNADGSNVKLVSTGKGRCT